MLSKLSYANVMATVAVFIALGGTGYAAVTITGANVKNNSLTSADVKDRSLLKKDFKLGQVPPGATGAKGDTGAPGANGAKGDPCLATDPACRGPQGPAGAKGDTGAPGANGAKGDPCLATDPACRGPQGTAGATGAKGDTGATGPTGPQGPKGDPGTTTTFSTVVGTTRPVGAGSPDSFTLSCPAGRVAVSAGFSQTNDNVQLSAAFRTADGTGYTIRVGNQGSISAFWTPEVVCAG